MPKTGSSYQVGQIDGRFITILGGIVTMVGGEIKLHQPAQPLNNHAAHPSMHRRYIWQASETSRRSQADEGGPNTNVSHVHKVEVPQQRYMQWQVWHFETSSFGVALGDIKLCFTWQPGLSLCMADMALDNTYLHFAWHAWLRVALSWDRRTVLVRLRLADMALGDINLRFTWQAWHWHGTWIHEFRFTQQIALGNMDFHFAQPAFWQHVSSLCVFAFADRHLWQW